MENGDRFLRKEGRKLNRWKMAGRRKRRLKRKEVSEVLYIKRDLTCSISCKYLLSLHVRFIGSAVKEVYIPLNIPIIYSYTRRYGSFNPYT